MTQNPAIPATVPAAPRRLLVPRAPVVVLHGHKLACLTVEGEIRPLTIDTVREMVRQTRPIVCHGPHLARFLGIDRFPAYDVLELFAFIHPGRFTVPTPAGIARSLHLFEPATAEDMCLSLRESIRHLLTDLTASNRTERTDPAALAALMGLGLAEGDGSDHLRRTEGWGWTPVVLAALGRQDNPPRRGDIKAALRLWDKLPEWAQHAPPPPQTHLNVSPEEAEERLKVMLGQKQSTGHGAGEIRPQQSVYARHMAGIFTARDHSDTAHVLMAEAGTGTGKTLGYLAPATVWAEKNAAPVWISTYTKNLQRQVEGELARLYPDPVDRAHKVVTRKGRENYLCLLNLEDATQSQTLSFNAQNAVALGLMLRWAAVTGDGDLTGKDFPGWLSALIGHSRVNALADQRGECIYSACPHFDRCFVEKSIRTSKRAHIVIANHALVMHQTARAAAAGGDDRRDPLPSRYVFDEGHHVFEAADSAYGVHFNGQETHDMRRWIVGNETDRKSRARGLKRRLEDIIAGDDDALQQVELILDAARALPGQGWRQRLTEAAPQGAVEKFLLLCRQQVLARNPDTAGGYSLETAIDPPVAGLADAAAAVLPALQSLKQPMLRLATLLSHKLEREAEDLTTDMRERIQYMQQRLTERAESEIGGWVSLLASLNAPKSPETVDWLEITRGDGYDADCGFYRAYVDPAQLFAATLKPFAHGVAMTSATLRDQTEEDPDGWDSPRLRTGLNLFETEKPAPRLHLSSPFDYAAATRIFIIRDVPKDDIAAVSGAMRALFQAAGGGGLGLFTAIQRLRAVQEKIVTPLESAGIPLYAQHVDALDTGTLIDIFRAEENACLLGTDATRDGIDVPGRSLRLVVYDRVPWPRPTLLHKARRDYFGRSYDDMLTRFKIKQAFGRLIRRQSDRGVFVMLDSALPSRLLTAFPAGVEVARISLKEALIAITDFLQQKEESL